MTNWKLNVRHEQKKHFEGSVEKGAQTLLWSWWTTNFVVLSRFIFFITFYLFSSHWLSFMYKKPYNGYEVILQLIFDWWSYSAQPMLMLYHFYRVNILFYFVNLLNLVEKECSSKYIYFLLCYFIEWALSVMTYLSNNDSLFQSRLFIFCSSVWPLTTNLKVKTFTN